MNIFPQNWLFLLIVKTKLVFLLEISYFMDLLKVKARTALDYYYSREGWFMPLWGIEGIHMLNPPDEITIHQKNVVTRRFGNYTVLEHSLS